MFDSYKMMSVSSRSENCRVTHGQARDSRQTDRTRSVAIGGMGQEENGTTEERDNMLIVIVIYMTVDKKMI